MTTADDITKGLQTFIDTHEISGAVILVAKEERSTHVGAVGLADIDTDRAMTEDTIFAIASMTKPVTATALMLLQEAGELSIDDPVATTLPAFADVTLAGGRPYRPVTLRDLLTHTSGLVGSQACYGSLAETAAKLASRPLAFEPGSEWRYSPGLNVCGRIIEVVSGQPFDSFLRQHIIEPLEMRDTAFTLTEAQKQRCASIYRRNAETGTLEVDPQPFGDMIRPEVPNPSGGLKSTARDMGRFYQMILNGGILGGKRLLSAQTVAQMTTLQTGDLVTGFTPGNGWGLGWCVVRTPQGVTGPLSPGTYGHGGAFGTQGWVDPQTRTVFVLMVQRSNFPNSDASEVRRVFTAAAAESSSLSPPLPLDSCDTE